MVFPVYFVLFILLLPPLPAHSKPKCEKSFNCGNISSLEFPFSLTPECGIFLVNCTSPSPILDLGAEGASLEIHNKISDNKVLVKDLYFSGMSNAKSCLSFWLAPYTIKSKDHLVSFSIHPNITLLSCPKNLSPQTRHQYFHDFNSFNTCDAVDLYYRDPLPQVFPLPTPECHLVHMPFKSVPKPGEDLLQLFSPEFEVEWNVSADCVSCHQSGGMCLTDTNNLFWCKGGEPEHKPITIIISVSGATVLTAAIIITFLVIRNRRKNKLHNLFILQKQQSKTQNAVELFLNNHGNIPAVRYKYSDLKKITNFFAHELGRGGFGCVFKGKLPNDQRLVAVKILSKLTEGGEEFINEVASISRTSHVNIVTLLGYCIEGSKRALIYEFMPNGSLEKYIQHKTGPPPGELGWDKLFNIAIDTARGLEYLHQGCNTRILHFDIKPHNILLDKDFNPKISDFGLAKLCPNRSSLVSMLAARGTIGYIAPEVFCRNFGGVSHKSDTYSYGMMVLEMALGRQKVDARVDQSSEMYFPDWIYKHLEVSSGVEFVESVRNEEEWKLGRKMIIVGLWCIQTEPRNRPSMSRVVEMLGGSVDSLEIPPTPYLALPPLHPHASSANAIEGFSSLV